MGRNRPAGGGGWKSWNNERDDSPADLFWEVAPRYIEDDEVGKRLVKFLTKCWQQARISVKHMVDGRDADSAHVDIDIGDGSPEDVRAGFVKAFIADVLFRLYQAQNGMDMGLDRAEATALFQEVCCTPCVIPPEVAHGCRPVSKPWAVVSQAIQITFRDLYKSDEKLSGGKKRSGGGGRSAASSSSKRPSASGRTASLADDEEGDWWNKPEEEWEDPQSSAWVDWNTSPRRRHVREAEEDDWDRGSWGGYNQHHHWASHRDTREGSRSRSWSRCTDRDQRGHDDFDKGKSKGRGKSKSRSPPARRGTKGGCDWQRSKSRSRSESRFAHRGRSCSSRRRLASPRRRQPPPSQELDQARLQPAASREKASSPGAASREKAQPLQSREPPMPPIRPRKRNQSVSPEMLRQPDQAPSHERSLEPRPSAERSLEPRPSAAVASRGAAGYKSSGSAGADREMGTSKTSAVLNAAEKAPILAPAAAKREEGEPSRGKVQSKAKAKERRIGAAADKKAPEHSRSTALSAASATVKAEQKESAVAYNLTEDFDEAQNDDDMDDMEMSAFAAELAKRLGSVEEESKAPASDKQQRSAAVAEDKAATEKCASASKGCCFSAGVADIKMQRLIGLDIDSVYCCKCADVIARAWKVTRTDLVNGKALTEGASMSKRAPEKEAKLALSGGPSGKLISGAFQ